MKEIDVDKIKSLVAEFHKASNEVHKLDLEVLAFQKKKIEAAELRNSVFDELYKEWKDIVGFEFLDTNKTTNIY